VTLITSFDDSILCMHENSCASISTKFEVPSFTNSKDMIGDKIKNNGTYDPDHAN